jgi:hypothetical protein
MSKNRKPSALVEHLENRQLLAATPLPKITAHGVGTLNTTEQQPLSAVVATFTDSIAEPIGNFTAKITWGEPGAAITDGVITSDESGGFIVSGSNTYKIPTPAAGLGRPVTVRILDSGVPRGLPAVSHVKVADATLTPSQPGAHDFTVTKSAIFVGVVATFTDADPTATVGPPSTHTATINWGNGISAGKITQDPNTGVFFVTGTHVYGIPNTYAGKVVIHDKGGATVNTTFTATVTPPQPTTNPNFIGVYKGKAKVGGLIGSLAGSRDFEIDVTGETLTTLTGEVFFNGISVASGTFDAGIINGATIGLLSNGNFIFTKTSGGTTVTISGHLDPLAKAVTSGLIVGTGLPVPGFSSLHANFTLTKQ